MCFTFCGTPSHLIGSRPSVAEYAASSHELPRPRFGQLDQLAESQLAECSHGTGPANCGWPWMMGNDGSFLHMASPRIAKFQNLQRLSLYLTRIKL